MLATGLGIGLGSVLNIPLSAWLTISFLFLAASIFLQRRSRQTGNAKSIWQRAATANVLLTLCLVGGTNQHLRWSMRPVNDISTFTDTDPRLARVVGIVSTPIEILPSKFGPRIPPWMELDRSTCYLQCELVGLGENTESVSGTVRMDVTGHLVHVRVGDRVEVLGRLVAPQAPDNPGGRDYRAVLQRQGISCLLRVEHPAAVTQLGPVPGFLWTLARWRESIRSECVDLFAKNLSPDLSGLASSLLIGDRTMLTEELQDQFAQTGTTHLLAISGLHVGILLGLVLMICRIFCFDSKGAALALIASLATYVFITDLRAPVLRAGLLAMIAVIGTLRRQRVDRMNALAVSALVLLLSSPGDLFDIGAQLSFLAVGAILWSLDWRPAFTPAEKSLQQLLREESLWFRLWKPVGSYLADISKMTIAVTLATLPITMSAFHLVAPVGVLLNLVLIPYISIVLGFGYLLMAGGLVLPAIAPVLAFPFRWSLQLLRWSVAWGQSVPGGHLYLPGIPFWWLCAFYILLPCAWKMVGTRYSARWSLIALLAWCVIGLTMPLLPHTRSSFRCTFLSVGHGLACVLEYPTGEVLLYDAGTLGDGERATRAVANALWARGISQIDAVVVSHADHDHFSGLFGLLDQFPVSSIFFARQFLDFQQQGVADLCDLAASKHIEMKLIQAEDELQLVNRTSHSPSLRVLYPPDPTGPRSDNANSLVMALSYADRQILFTGDIELQGLDDVLKLPAMKTDVLLSPHHGGKVANVIELYRWAQPTYAIVSSSERTLPNLTAASALCDLMNTATAGAVTFEIFPDGRMHVTEQKH